MRPITSPCRPGTAAARSMRWRLLGLLINLALWGGLITLARMVF